MKYISCTLDIVKVNIVVVSEDTDGMITPGVITRVMPKSIYENKKLAREYIAETCDVDAKTIFRVDMIDDLGCVNMRMSIGDFYNNAEIKED